jgi:hypothetical protein
VKIILQNSFEWAKQACVYSPAVEVFYGIGDIQYLFKWPKKWQKKEIYCIWFVKIDDKITIMTLFVVYSSTFFILQVEPKELRVHMVGAGSNMAAVGPIHITNLGPDTAFKLSIFVLQVSFCILT